MQTFKDSNGVTWTVRITGDAIQRVWDGTKIDLSNASTVLQKISESGPILLTILFFIVRKPDGTRPQSPDEFATGIDGEVFVSAQEGLLKALEDFFHPGPNGKMFSAHLAKAREFHGKVTALAMKEMEALDPAKILESFPFSGLLAPKPESTRET